MIKYLFFTFFIPKAKKVYQIMKLSIILLFAVIFQLIASSVHGQNAVIRLESGALTLEGFINQIEKQTDYLVIFSNQEINPQKEINLSADRKSTRLNSSH